MLEGSIKGHRLCLFDANAMLIVAFRFIKTVISGLHTQLFFYSLKNIHR